MCNIDSSLKVPHPFFGTIENQFWHYGCETTLMASHIVIHTRDYHRNFCLISLLKKS